MGMELPAPPPSEPNTASIPPRASPHPAAQPPPDKPEPRNSPATDHVIAVQAWEIARRDEIYSAVCRLCCMEIVNAFHCLRWATALLDEFRLCFRL